MALAAAALVGCNPGGGSNTPETDMPEWYYTGGKLGTTTNTSSMTFRQPTPATEEAGLGTMFAQGDQIAEKPFVTNESGRQHGLGPVYVRASCQHCHPNYSHGTSVPEGTYDAANVGNGTLLVVINPATQAYVPWLAGMPQLFGAAPFKAPLDPDQITVTWKQATDEHGNQFADGEKYELRYPEVTMPNTAVYVYNQGYRDPDGLLETQGYEVKLENTIGVYGSGLLDAIPDQDIIDQYAKEAADGKLKNGLNPAFWDGGFQTSGYYKNDPQWGPKRFTYALTRGPIMDAAGANAIWNITNVSRSDRPYLYSTNAWAKKMSETPSVIAAIKANPNSPYYADGTDEGIAEAVNGLLSPGTNQFDNPWHNFEPEMSDQNFWAFMVWHRGLAIPRARNLNDPEVQRGKEVFNQIGCQYCHRAKWQTTRDDFWAPSIITSNNLNLPTYKNQTIYPYTDMVQHRLYMKNGIHGSWCRTTPLWGRGLSKINTGAEDRLHDCRARNEIEAIMWHGYSKNSDAYESTLKFYNLPKADRDAVVKFLRSI